MTSLDLDLLASTAWDGLLDIEYRPLCRRPAEMFGYCQLGDDETMAGMAADGANHGTTGFLYVPPETPEQFADGIAGLWERQRPNLQELTDRLSRYGFTFNVLVGCWNNGLFPYYPDWYRRRHPELAMLDQEGRPIMATMFPPHEEVRVQSTAFPVRPAQPWDSFEAPAVNGEVQAYIRLVVKHLQDVKALRYWSNGGEMLYPTYVFPGVWADYGSLAIAHFRAWLAEVYGHMGALNAAWGTDYKAFAEVEPPREIGVNRPSLDWHRFRLQALTEHYQWNHATVREIDRTRPYLGVMHGDPFHDLCYAELGESLAGLASVTDGFTTSQILVPDHKLIYNVQYLQSLSAFGKPLACEMLACASHPPEYFGQPLPPGAVRVNGSFTPEMARRVIYECLGYSAWHIGLVAYTGSLPDGDWQIKDRPAQAEVKRIFHELRALAPMLEGMAAWAPKLALYIPEPAWLLLGWQPDWARFQAAALRAHVPHTLIYDHPYGYKQTLPEPRRPRRIEVIIVAYATLVDPEALNRLERFVEEGGRLILIDDEADGRFCCDNSRLGWPDRPAWLEAAAPWQPGMDWRYQERRFSLGKGEVLHLRTPYARAFLNRIYYIADMWHDILLDRIVSFAEEKTLVRPFSLIATRDNGTHRGAFVEAFPLTDGLNHVIVLINTAPEPLRVRGWLAREFLADGLIYQATLPLRGISLGEADAKALSDTELSVELPPHGTEVLAISCQPPMEEAKRLLRNAEKDLKARHEAGFDVSLGRYFINAAEQAIEAGRPGKALAALARFQSLLYLRLDIRSDSIGETLNIQAVDRAGSPVVSGSALVILRPLFDQTFQAAERRPGTYTALIESAACRRVYDYTTQRYVAYEGPLEYRVRVVQNTRIGFTARWREAEGQARKG